MRKILLIVTVIVIAAAAAFGRIKRDTYTDITAQEGYAEQLLVAELTEEIAAYSCEEMRKSLPDAPIIAKVRVTGDYEPLFDAGRQKVRIETVYAGGELLTAGQEIYVGSSSWSICLQEELNTLERFFVNFMRMDTEYLVFGDEILEDLAGGLPAIKLCDIGVIVPVFSYEEFSHVILPIGEEHTYVPYSGVKDNEFFPASEESLALWQELKAEMLAAYP